MSAEDGLEPQELDADREISELFLTSAAPIELRLANFPVFVRHRYLARFLGLYEIFKRIVEVKGSIVECGVFQAGSLMTWVKLTRILDPSNNRRHVYGFDTFTGFPEGSSAYSGHGHFATFGGMAEVRRAVDVFERNDSSGGLEPVTLIQGDARETIPEFVSTHPHVVVALLFLDFDLYEPTVAALRNFLPRMPRGGVIVFDEIDDARWPGESQAVFEEIGFRNLRLQRIPFDANVGFAVLD